MLPDDPRHGTLAGWNAHRRAGQPQCEPCLTGKRRYEKQRLIHARHKVPALGSQRRIQALRAIGYSLQELADAGGWNYDHGAFKYPLRASTITVRTAERIAALYERLHLTPSTGPQASKCRIQAESKGWPTPDRWYDIDDPAEHPDPGYREARRHHDHDPVVVDRILAGDMSLAATATKAERVAVVARWSGSLNELERATGWQARRYRSEVA